MNRLCAIFVSVRSAARNLTHGCDERLEIKWLGGREGRHSPGDGHLGLPWPSIDSGHLESIVPGSAVSTLALGTRTHSVAVGFSIFPAAAVGSAVVEIESAPVHVATSRGRSRSTRGRGAATWCTALGLLLHRAFTGPPWPTLSLFVVVVVVGERMSSRHIGRQSRDAERRGTGTLVLGRRRPDADGGVAAHASTCLAPSIWLLDVADKYAALLLRTQLCQTVS